MKPLVIVFLALFLGSCVSVQLGTKGHQVSSSVKYDKPSAPFSPISDSPADKAWQSSATGNVIGFVSSCNNKSDPSLEAIESESLSALTNWKKIKSEYLTFNERKSLQTLALGNIDGIPVKLYFIIFKKNHCDYTLSYSGHNSVFDEELATFKKFSLGFKAP